MDEVDFTSTFRQEVQTVQNVPRWFQGCIRRAFTVALRELQSSRSAAAWKLLVLIPRMLLRPTRVQGQEGRRVFQERMEAFERGQWRQLLQEQGSEVYCKESASEAAQLQ